MKRREDIQLGLDMPKKKWLFVWHIKERLEELRAEVLKDHRQSGSVMFDYKKEIPPFWGRCILSIFSFVTVAY